MKLKKSGTFPVNTVIWYFILNFRMKDLYTYYKLFMKSKKSGMFPVNTEQDMYKPDSRTLIKRFAINFYSLCNCYIHEQ